jgi:NADH:ubiquinone oxidoreductase subunit K
MALLITVGGGFGSTSEAEAHARGSRTGSYHRRVIHLPGVVGVLSLTTAKSGALIGVLISVTTIPAAANIAVAAAYSDWDNMAGALAQLVVNIVAIVAAGTATLLLQRALFLRRMRRSRAADV